MKTSAMDLICRGIAAKSSNKLDNFILPLSFLCSIFHSIGHKDKPFSPKPRINFVAAKSSYKFGTSVLPFSLFCSNFHTISHKDGAFSPKSSIDLSRITIVDYVVSLVRKMVRMRPRPSVAEFNKLLNVVVEMKRYSVALCLFYEMRQLDAAPLNEDTMTIAMKCYCNLSQPKFGFAMLGILLKCGYTPKGATFITLIDGLFMNNKVAEAEELFKKLSLKLCEPDKVMIFTVVEGLCSFGRILTAYDLVRLSEETSYKPGVDSFNILIDSLWKLCGRIDDAFQLFMKMIDMGISPNDFTYNSIVQGLSKFRRWEEVKDILAKVVDRNVSLDVIYFNELVTAFCKDGNVKEAEYVLETMMQRDIRPNATTYAALIDRYCKRGQIDEASKMFDSIEDGDLEQCIINSMIDGYCQMGKVDEAWQLFLEVPCKGLKHDTNTYNTMIRALFCHWRFAQGWKLFSEMEACGLVPDVVTCNILLEGLCSTQPIAEAFQFLRRMEEKGVYPNVVSYGIIIHGLCESGELDTAKKLFDSLLSKGWQPTFHMYNRMIGSLCQEGLEEEAKSLFREMEKSGCQPDRVTYNAILEGLLKRNEVHKAVLLLEEMHDRWISIDAANEFVLLICCEEKVEMAFIWK